MARKPKGGAPTLAPEAPSNGEKPVAQVGGSNGHFDRDEFERVKTKLHDRNQQQEAIFRARQEIKDCHRRIKELAADSKEAKEDLKDAEAFLEKLIDAQASGQKTLPLKSDVGNPAKPKKPEAAAPPDKPSETSPVGAKTEAETPTEGAGVPKPLESATLFTTPESRMLLVSCPASHIGRTNSAVVQLPGKKREAHTGICAECYRQAVEAEKAALRSMAGNGEPPAPLANKPKQAPPVDGPLAEAFADISPAVLGRLADAKIVTVSDYEKAVGDGRIKNIQGLGPTKLETLAAAYQAFRKSGPQKSAEPSPAAKPAPVPEQDQAQPIDDLGDEFDDEFGDDEDFEEVDELPEAEAPVEPGEESQAPPDGLKGASDDPDEVISALFDVFVRAPGEVVEGWTPATRKAIHAWAIDVSNAADGMGEAPPDYPRQVERFMPKDSHSNIVAYVRKRRGG